MKILDLLLSRLRRGIATSDEIENLDRRLFCLGAAASAGGLIARPTIVDLGATGLWWGLSAGLTGTALGLTARFWWLTSKPVAES